MSVKGKVSYKGKRSLRRLVCLMLAAILMVSGMVVSIGTMQSEAAIYYEEGPEIYGISYCAIDLDTGEIMFAKNATKSLCPASITKVLTALVVLENVDDLDSTLTFSENAVTSITSNSSTLHPVAAAGEKMSVRDVLYGLLLCSGNECANALAEYVAGSNEAFADMMNEKAQEIGVVNSHFANPHGLYDENHYTCAYDIALIYAEAMKNEEFAKIDSTATYTIGATNKNDARTCTMGHKMVNGELPYEGVFAGKTGRTVEAGRTLLTAAEHNGRRFVVSLMHSTDDAFYEDAQTLLDYAYAQIDGKIEGEWVWQGTEEPETVTATGNVNIRELPTVHSFAQGTLKEGEEVVRTGYVNNWSRILWNDRVLYVNSAYLSPLVGNTQEPKNDAAETTAESVTETEKATEETNEEVTETVTEAVTETASEAVTETEVVTDQETEGTTEGTTTVEATDTQGTKKTSWMENSDLVIPIVLISVCSLLLIVIIIFVIYYIKAAKAKNRRRRMHSRNMRMK